MVCCTGLRTQPFLLVTIFLPPLQGTRLVGRGREEARSLKDTFRTETVRGFIWIRTETSEGRYFFDGWIGSVSAGRNYGS